ncbi:MAG: GtrA family protein [Planctomycetes bacterium]|nr:GtrA family protein [Planctomycetota bacterium]
MDQIGGTSSSEARTVSVVLASETDVAIPRIAVEAIGSALTSIGWNHEILVADRTPTHVIGAIERARGHYVVVANAEAPDAVERIPDMIRRLEDGECDFVIGARRFHGSSVLRRWRSRAAALLALGLVRLRDPMSEFFAFPRNKKPDVGTLSPSAHRLGLELLVKGHFERPEAVPIADSVERRTRSRLGWRENARALRHLHRLYAHRFPAQSELIQFGLVGATGFLVDLAVYSSLLWGFGVQHLASRAISFWFAATWNWAWNRALTFAGRQRTSKRVQWLKFLASSAFGFCVNWGVYYTLTSEVVFFADGWPRVLALFLGVLAGMGLNFILARTFVFLPHGDTPAVRRGRIVLRGPRSRGPEKLRGRKGA